MQLNTFTETKSVMLSSLKRFSDRQTGHDGVTATDFTLYIKGQQLDSIVHLGTNTGFQAQVYMF